MTEHEQRITIAEACGWTQIHNAYTMAAGGIWVGYPSKNAIIGYPDYVPDYLHDLNAMAGAEACLVYEQRYQFVTVLADMFGGRITCMVSADAKYRAEAFLRATGKIPVDSPIIITTINGTKRTITPTVITQGQVMQAKQIERIKYEMENSGL